MISAPILALVVALVGTLAVVWVRQRAAGGPRALGFSAFVQHNGIVVSAYLTIAVTIWVVMLIVLPQLYMVDFSFRFNLPPAEVGGIGSVIFACSAM